MKPYRLFILLVCLPVWLWSQQSDSQTNLVGILSKLEGRFDIQISYVDEVVEGKLAVEPDSTLSLKEQLLALEKATRLRYELLNTDYVVVRNYRPNDRVSLCGRTSDHTGGPVFGVTVSYSDTEGVFTDQDGSFQLDSIPFSSWLTFRSVGYATKRLKVSRLSFAECITIRMAESIEVLKEVVVNDYLTTGISKNQNAIHIDPHELKTLSGLAEPDIMQSIQQVPGVNSPFETATGIHVRGGLPDQNLILWNDIPTYNQGHFFGMISAFNPYVTDKVTFIKHGTPAIYGDRISSVIDIRSTQEVAEVFSGGVGTNMLYTDGYANIPVIDDMLSVQVSARRSFTDVFQSPTYQQMADRVFQNTKIDESASTGQQAKNNFYFNDYTINSVWKMNSNNKLIFNGLYNRNKLDYVSEDVTNDESYSDQLLNANEGLSLSWKSDISDKLIIDMNSNYSRYLLKYDFIQSVADTITTSSKKNFARDFRYQLNTSYQLDAHHHIKGGYHLSDSRIQYAYETEAPAYSIVLDADNSTVRTHSGYAEYTYETDRLLITPGVRVNYYEQLDKAFIEPRFYAQIHITNPLSISMSGEYRTQAASQIKESVVSDLSLENKVWALASPGRFPIIKSYQLASGIKYQQAGWMAELEGYSKEVRGVTTLIFGYLNGLDNQFRMGNSDIYGADFFLKRTWMNYESWLSYSYIKTQNSFTDLNNNQPFPGSWSIEHTVRWSNILQVHEWEFSLGWMWHTGKSYTDVSAVADESGGPVSIFYESINANNLTDYHRMDFSVMRELSSGNNKLRYRIGLSILNLYNRKNLLNREFRTTPSLDNELIDTRVYSLGITPNLVFRLFW